MIKSISLLAIFVTVGFFSGCATHQMTQSQKEALVERVLPGMAESLVEQQPRQEEMETMLKDYLKSNPEIYGIAFAPARPQRGANPKPALYVSRRMGGLATTELMPPNYDYFRMAWYKLPVKEIQARWTSPYFDEDGGNIWMKTYSIPMFGGGSPEGLYGVVTSDIRVSAPRN